MSESNDEEVPFPSFDHSASFDAALARSHLSPDDAFVSPPRRNYSANGRAEPRPLLSVLRGERSRSRRRKRTWKKLMWVKQSYPDNYTDQATFLENLQLNPRLKPYDFWPLVADSTVILQHVCTVIIFVVCFVGIFQERVSPVAVVSYSSIATFLGWIVWEQWVAAEEEEERKQVEQGISAANASQVRAPGARRRTRTGSIRRPLPPLPSVPASAAASPMGSSTDLRATLNKPLTLSATSLGGSSTSPLPSNGHVSASHTPRASQEYLPPVMMAFPDESPLHQRLGTIKSAILIYCTLLGLSPILKSLTKSTSSDSIWAMSFWLLAINVFFFDYGGEVGAKFPASLSTNAALMASTVLASRLPSTQQVFSLTMFSIEVFGLFPVFRRHVKHQSLTYHVTLSMSLVAGAGLGVGMVLGDSEAGKWPWKSGIVGVLVAYVVAAVAMGGCSWWLIGLQKYKNEIRGPWDPARPIIMSRPRWDDG